MTMQAEHANDELLQRHFDGDLERTQAEPLEAHLRTCAECAAKRAKLGRLSNMVHAAALESAADVDFAAMFTRIEKGIDAQAAAPEPKPAGKVVPMRRRSPVLAALTAASAGLAVAAAVLLMVYDGGSTGRQRSIPDGTMPTGAPTTATDGPSAQPPAPSHSEVVEVDFGANTGTVFDIAMSDGSTTPVVWINDDE